MKEKVKQINIRVSEEKYKRLKKVAIDKETNVSKIIRELVDKYLNESS